LKIRHALFIAAVLNLVGAILLGGNVSQTLIGGITHGEYFRDAGSYVAGMLASMIAAGGFIFIATHTGLPVSSTHAIVGGMLGVAATVGGVDAINWRVFGTLTLSWALTPFLAAACSLATIKLIRLAIYRDDVEEVMRRACLWIPAFASAMLAAALVAVAHGTKFFEKFDHRGTVHGAAAVTTVAMFVVFRAITKRLAVKFSGRGDFAIEHIFRRFQAGTSCLVGFAIGSNDVANSVTPAIAIYFVTRLGLLPSAFVGHCIPPWILAMGGLCMAIGVLSLGHRVIGTLGRNLTLLTNSRGFSVDFSTAMTIIVASVFGLPISSTHAATGAIIGVGVDKGFGRLNLRLLSKIFIAWFLTVPLSAIFAIFVYFVLRVITLPFS
jgi:PiT family inorganic phosphate transporter